MRVWSHPNRLVRETIFRPLGVLHLKFLHGLEIDQGLLAHATNRVGVLPEF